MIIETNEDIPLKIHEQDAYYWMDDHIEVASAYLDQENGMPYNLKHSFCPSDVNDPNLQSPYGMYEFSETGDDFHRLKPQDVNPEFRATLLLLGIDTNDN